MMIFLLRIERGFAQEAAAGRPAAMMEAPILSISRRGIGPGAAPRSPGPPVSLFAPSCRLTSFEEFMLFLQHAPGGPSCACPQNVIIVLVSFDSLRAAATCLHLKTLFVKLWQGRALPSRFCIASNRREPQGLPYLGVWELRLAFFDNSQFAIAFRNFFAV